MTSQYVIVRYVPDPIADERLNVGAIVFSEGIARARFVSNWQRVRQFGGEDVAFLRDFAHRATVALSAQDTLFDKERWDEAVIAEIGTWKNSLQFSEPRASLSDPDALLTEVYRRYVRLHRVIPRGVRDKRSAAAAAGRRLTAAFSARFGVGGEEVVRRNARIPGKLTEHKFDIVAQNGRPYMAAQALSFQIATTGSLEKEVDSVAWSLQDVRAADRGLELAVAVIPPARSTALYDKATHIFTELGARVVEPEDLDDWAQDSAKLVKL